MSLKIKELLGKYYFQLYTQECKMKIWKLIFNKSTLWVKLPEKKNVIVPLRFFWGVNNCALRKARGVSKSFIRTVSQGEQTWQNQAPCATVKVSTVTAPKPSAISLTKVQHRTSNCAFWGKNKELYVNKIIFNYTFRSFWNIYVWIVQQNARAISRLAWLASTHSGAVPHYALHSH